MRAASRALLCLLFAIGLGWTTPAAAADAACPAEVGGLPLSVTVPFSGTERPEAGDDGEIESTSLLCAYGEGVAPSVEVLLTWSDDCGSATTEVADGVDPAPFDALADDLVAGVGGACAAASGAGFPYVPVALGGLLVVGIAIIVVRRRREPVPAPVEPPAPARPDVAPVLAHLSTRDGRVLARSASGQWLALAALAVGHDDAVAAAEAGAAQPGRRPARADLAALAHQLAGADR